MLTDPRDPFDSPPSGPMHWWSESATRFHVLIIEDNDEHRFCYRQFLACGGYRVSEAADGRAGLASAQGDVPDVILLDINMPGIDGWTVARELQGDGRTAKVPIIVISVHAFPADHNRSVAAGCALHLDKPVGPIAVLSAVDGILGVTRPAA